MFRKIAAKIIDHNTIVEVEIRDIKFICLYLI